MKKRKLTLYLVQRGDWDPEVFTSEKEAAREVGEYIDYVYDQLGELYEDERVSTHKTFEQKRAATQDLWHEQDIFTPKKLWIGVWNLNVHAGYFVQEVFVSPLSLMEP